MLVLFALLLPLVLAIGAIVITIGSWHTHAKHLQTKVDAAAFAGGGSWGFPCGPDIDADIESEARKYVGVHTQADTTLYSTTTHNPQVGGVQGDQIMVALNQAQWWDESYSAADWTSPAGSVCQSKVLDVKATESDSPLLWGWLPFWPDIKKKARVQIEEVAGLTGLLPIAVRLPQPLSAAAVFYNEADGTILDVEYFREVCTPFSPGCIFGMPPGLGQWTTEPAAGDTSDWARFSVAGTTGVVVATSVRPRCGAGTPPAGPPCLNASGWTGQPVDTFCRASGVVQCYDADGSGTTQTVRSGVHFIRGYGNTDTGTGPPQLRTAYLDSQSLNCAPYFNSSPSACTVRLNVAVDLGALLGQYPNSTPPPDQTPQPLRAGDVEVRYRLVRADGSSFCNYGAECDLLPGDADSTGVVTFSTTAGPTSPHLPITAASRGNAVAIQVKLRNTTNASDPECGADYSDLCRWFYTASSVDPDTPPTDTDILSAPIQRSFMGELDRTGPLKWLRLTVDKDCDPTTLTGGDRIIGADPVTGDDAASQPAGVERCYVVDMGLSGGMARDQDEPPIALNLGNNSSQRAYVDCDPNIQPDPREEIVKGCQWPSYAANRFDTSPTCPGVAGFWTVPKPAPFANWPAFRCVLTQTGNSVQVIQGFNERIFNRSNNPTCPADIAGEYVEGRNYWHRMNNDYDEETFAWDGTGPPGPDGDRKGNTLRSDDPRLVTLFFTTYDSFTGTGNQVYPIVGFGNFYVTGYGETQTGSLLTEDPCDEGNDGDLYNGTGNEPPPDLDYSSNTRWVWGHFVKDVIPNPFSIGGSGVLCNPEASFQPCVAVLVE